MTTTPTAWQATGWIHATQACERVAYHGVRGALVLHAVQAHGTTIEGAASSLAALLALLALCQVAGGAIAGRWLDAHRLAAIGLLLIGAAALVLLAPHPASLGIGATLLVVGSGLCRPAVLLAMAQATDRRDASRAVAFGVLHGIALVAAMLGTMAMIVSTRGAFAIAAVVALIGGVLAWRIAPAPASAPDFARPPAAMALTALVVAVLCIAVHQGLDAPRAVALLTLAVLGGLFVVHTLRDGTRAWTAWLGVLCAAALAWSGVLLGAAVADAMTASDGDGVLRLANAVGAVLTVLVLALACVWWSRRPRTDAAWPWRSFAFGLAALALGLAAIVALPHVSTLIALLLGLAVAEVCVLPVLHAVIARETSAGMRGLAYGTVAVAMSTALYAVDAARITIDAVDMTPAAVLAFCIGVAALAMALLAWVSRRT